MSIETVRTIPMEDFRQVLLGSLEEATTSVHGFFLDKGDSLFETLAPVTAVQASAPLGPGSGTIAAKVNHIRFYVDAVLANAKAGAFIPVDWASSWAVETVTDEEWADLVARLKATFAEFRQLASVNDQWPEPVLGGAFGVVIHTGYHLGEIRQALAYLRHTGEAS
ncbi:MAG TPA: hypothetical protein VEW66_09225 [Thermomicrobiales bacterium]|nr:hypothetical protein [Thermomicrobiales bacterium]